MSTTASSSETSGADIPLGTGPRDGGVLGRLGWVVSPVLAIGCVVLIVVSWTPSANAAIYIFSPMRAAFLAGMAVACLYFVAATFHPLLRRINSELVIIGLLTLALHEMALRAVPGYFNDWVVTVLPAAARTQAGFDTRMEINGDQVRGEGMLYHMEPGGGSSRYPWVKADANGFRNPSTPGASVDVVYLGGSLALSAGLRTDLAGLSRAVGLSAYSLAIGSYSSFQSALAYRKYIADAGVDNSHVVLLVSVRRNIDKARSFLSHAARGGNWRSYLWGETAPESVGPFIPWTFLVVEKAYSDLLWKLRVREAQPVTIRAPWGEMTIDYSAFGASMEYPQEDWDRFAEGLESVSRVATENGACLHVVNIPEYHVVALPFISDERISGIVENETRRDVARVKRIAAGLGAGFLDITPHLRKAYAERKPEKGADLHLDAHEQALLFDALKPRLSQPCRQTGS